LHFLLDLHPPLFDPQVHNYLTYQLQLLDICPHTSK